MEQQRSVEDLFIRSTDSNSSTSTDECRNRRPQTTVVGDGKSCLICGHVSHGFHFGILACRACAAFFRRTVVENKIYKCRQKCQCIIRKDMRNTCRHCRFEKCVALGMNKHDVQMNRDPIGSRVVDCCTRPSNCCDINGKIRDKEDETHEPVFPSTSSSIVAAPLATSATSSVLTETLADVFPRFTQALQSATIAAPSMITSAITPSSLFTSVSSVVPTLSSAPLQAAFPVITNVQLPTVSNLVRPLSSLMFQQQQATMALLQNATELASREHARADEMRFLPFQSPSESSILLRLQEGYANYQSSQKSLYTAMYLDNVFSAEVYRLVKHSEHVKMERGCLSLMFSMVGDWFQPFGILDHALKVPVLRAFYAPFSYLDKCFKTTRAFPEMDDTRIVLHYGQYIDINKLDFFFQEHKDPSATINTVKDILTRCVTLTNKMKKLKIREYEVAALAGIILWNEVALVSNSDNTDKIQGSIYSELHKSTVLTYGIMETGARMGSLLCLLHDLNTIAREINESALVGKFFNPHASDLWNDAV